MRPPLLLLLLLLNYEIEANHFENECTLCAGGLMPLNVSAAPFCSTALEQLRDRSEEAETTRCKSIQLNGYLLCECPDPPTPLLSPECNRTQLCPEGFPLRAEDKLPGEFGEPCIGRDMRVRFQRSGSCDSYALEAQAFCCSGLEPACTICPDGSNVGLFRADLRARINGETYTNCLSLSYAASYLFNQTTCAAVQEEYAFTCGCPGVERPASAPEPKCTTLCPDPNQRLPEPSKTVGFQLRPQSSCANFEANAVAPGTLSEQQCKVVQFAFGVLQCGCDALPGQEVTCNLCPPGSELRTRSFVNVGPSLTSTPCSRVAFDFSTVDDQTCLAARATYGSRCCSDFSSALENLESSSIETCDICQGLGDPRFFTSADSGIACNQLYFEAHNNFTADDSECLELKSSFATMCCNPAPSCLTVCSDGSDVATDKMENLLTMYGTRAAHCDEFGIRYGLERLNAEECSLLHYRAAEICGCPAPPTLTCQVCKSGVTMPSVEGEISFSCDNSLGELLTTNNTQMCNLAQQIQGQYCGCSGEAFPPKFDASVCRLCGDRLLPDPGKSVGSSTCYFFEEFANFGSFSTCDFYRNRYGQECCETPAPTEAPTETPMTADTDMPSTIFCFAGDATVEVRDRGIVRMDELKVGVFVRTTRAENNDEVFWDRVYGFGHLNATVFAAFLEIHTNISGIQPLHISNDHLIFVEKEDNGAKGGFLKAVPASKIKVGDTLAVTGTWTTRATVVKIKIVNRQGAYAPFTESGRVIVNNILASSYVSLSRTENVKIGGVNLPLSMQWAAHVATAPRRFLCWINFEYYCTNEEYDLGGLSTWVVGPFEFAQYLLFQRQDLSLMEWMLLIVTFCAFAIFAIVFQNPVPSILGSVIMFALFWSRSKQKNF